MPGVGSVCRGWVLCPAVRVAMPGVPLAPVVAGRRSAVRERLGAGFPRGGPVFTAGRGN